MKRPPIHLSWEAGAPPPDLDEKVIRRALAAFLTDLGHPSRGVSLLIADDPALRKLNRAHRGRARPTDVLSWRHEEPAEPLLGELAVSLDRVRLQAARNGWDAPTELMRLLAHGCAHLAGFDHETPAEEARMLPVEIQLLAGIGLENIYPREPKPAGRFRRTGRTARGGRTGPRAKPPVGQIRVRREDKR